MILSALFSLAIVLTGYFSKNKYALLAALRSLLLMINLELLFGIFLLIILFFSKSMSILMFNYLQETSWLFLNFIYIIGVIVIIFFLETGRAPFDLHEAESELVSGYNVEYGGFYFALYYLGEYFHLFFFASFFIILMFGFIEPMFLIS